MSPGLPALGSFYVPRAASPEYKKVPRVTSPWNKKVSRVASPRYIYVPRAASPMYLYVTGLPALGSKGLQIILQKDGGGP